MGNDDDVADRRKVLGSRMFAQILAGIWQGVALTTGMTLGAVGACLCLLSA